MFATCVFFDFETNDWNAKGCRADSISADGVKCLCDHLTNFAVLVLPENQRASSLLDNTAPLSIISFSMRNDCSAVYSQSSHSRCNDLCRCLRLLDCGVHPFSKHEAYPTSAPYPCAAVHCTCRVGDELP